MAELADAADSKSYTCRQESADQHEGREPLQGQGNRRGRGNEGAIGWNSGAGARDLNHAIQLISQNPGVKVKCGRIEIRPAADLNEMMRESERRRRKDTSR